jgi:NTP pyrophosphatase (non-canonical NTP hydrolase)
METMEKITELEAGELARAIAKYDMALEKMTIANREYVEVKRQIQKNHKLKNTDFRITNDFTIEEC